MLSVHGVCAYTALYIVCGVALAALLRWRSVRRTLVASAHLPSPPKPHFFMGHLLEWFIVNGARKHDWATEMLRHLKAPTMFIRSVPIGPTGHRIVTTDPAVVKHILADKFDRYVKKLDYIFGFRALLGDGIFSIDHGPHAADGGAAWRRQRKLAARIFTVNNFKASMCDAFRRNAAAVQAVLARRAGAPVDIQDLWFRFTMDSIGELGFGVQMGTLQEAMGGGGGGGGTARGLLFARAFDSAHRRMLSFKHSLLTLLSIDLLPPPFRQLGRAVFSRLNGNAVGFFADIAALDSFSYKLIRQRRAEGAAALDAKGDLLALFMRAPLDEGEPAVSDRELRDVVMSFIIAGRDTTACLLSWATLLLCQHPRIAAKLRAEIAEALPGGAQPDFLSVKKMPYLAAVLKEALRLFPPVPSDAKYCAQDDELPGGVPVAAGTLIVFLPFGMGRSEAIWGPDALEVRPERHLEGSGASKKTFFENPVFQAGPRICLGMNMAMFEASVALVMVLQQFKLRLAAPEQPPTYNALALTMGIEGGLSVIAEPI